VVEHPLGKGEVECSIHSGSTIRLAQRNPMVDERPKHPAVASFESLLALRNYATQNPQDSAGIFARFCAENFNVSRVQLFQDMLVILLLRGKRNGFFVEFGATDGVSLSNSFVLEKNLQWKGILAEPARCWHERLKANRGAAIDHRCVWSKTGETLTFLETNIGELSTISDLRDRDFKRDGGKDGTTYGVETIRLNDLLSSHGAPAAIDYMSIDTEGSEFQILNAFNFKKYQVKIQKIPGQDRHRRAQLLRASPTAGKSST
jgi:FkbM family methyltransferase